MRLPFTSRLADESARVSAAIAKNKRAQETLMSVGRFSIRRGTGQARGAQEAIALGKKRIKYAAGGAVVGGALYSSALGNTRYKNNVSTARGGLNPRSSGGFA